MSLFQGSELKPKKGRSIPLTVQAVKVYHPGYKPPKLMLLLPAFADQSGRCGVPFFVVLWACRILANNKDGCLREWDIDLVLTARNEDDKMLLSPGHYTYSVPGERDYAVCTAFRAWRLPGQLPFHWDRGVTGDGAMPPASTESTLSEVVKAADVSCVVTGVYSRRESCHMVPKAEKPWWIYNNMTARINDDLGINSTANCLSMRADLNAWGMDNGYFVFAPHGGKAACVCIHKEAADFAAEYHLRVVDIPPRINSFALYARFAWGIFKAVSTTLRDFELDKDTKTVPRLNLPSLESAGPSKPSKRRRTKDDDAGREDQADDDTGRDEQEDNDAGREEQEDDDVDGGGDTRQAMDDAGPLSGDDEFCSEAESEPSLDLCAWTEGDLAFAERKDAALASRPLTAYEVEAGMYPGYSRALRLKQEYRKQHPEISAVRRARVAHVGEDNYEQWL